MGRVLLVVLALNSLLAATIWESAFIKSLRATQRSALAWVRHNTARSSTFVVITSAGWTGDDVEEWFAALTDRRSLTTVQGYEWIPRAFRRQYDRDRAIQRCATRSSACVVRVMRQKHIEAQYIFVAKAPVQVGRRPIGAVLPQPYLIRDCCQRLRASLDHDPRVARVYNGPGASIYRLR